MMNPPSELKHGYVISDLHLFTHRSTVDMYLEGICEKAAEADFLVLNGDIFDFRWSILPGFSETLHAAMNWLSDLAASHPRCQIFYIMGNHDNLRQFALELDELTQIVPNLHWHDSHIKIDSALFLHGDLPLSPRNRNPFHRQLTSSEKLKGSLANQSYKAIIRVGLHKIPQIVHSPQFCAKRITRSLELHGQEIMEDITDVYFGHTHAPFADFKYKNLFFHNTGAAVRGIDSHLIRVRS